MIDGAAPASVLRALTHAAGAADDAAIAATRTGSDGLSAAARVSDARRGALSIRLLAPEGDGDATAIVAALRSRGHDAATWSFDHLETAGGPGGSLRYRGEVQPLPDLTLTYDPHLTPDKLAAVRALEARGVQSMNSAAGLEASFDKGTTAELLQAAGIAHPHSVVVSSPDEVRAAVEAVARPGVPTFLKNPVGTQGIGVAGIDDVETAVSVGQLVTAVPGGRRLVVQGGIPAAPGRPLTDSRFLVVDGKVTAVMDRVQLDPAKKLTGLHSAGIGVPREGTAAEIETVERAARELGIEGVAGVDVMGGHVLEANHGPGLRIGQVTGIDVTGAIASALERRAAATRR